jgi:hypothetical protein
MNTQPQPVSPTVLKSYRVDAALRFEGADTVQQISFIITAENGSKFAWVEARRITRVGGKVKTQDGSEIDLPAGLYTVRDVKSLDKNQPKPKIITIDTLLAAAEAENIPLSKKLLELIERLRASTPAPQSNGNGNGESAAA